MSQWQVLVSFVVEGTKLCMSGWLDCTAYQAVEAIEKGMKVRLV